MDKSTLQNIKLFLFDMDGTLYLGDRLFEFTPELLSTIKARGGRYLFMTNNSSKSVADYVKKLAKLGIESTEEDFITSSQATVYYLKKYHKDAVLYVCGTQSLIDEFKSHGFSVTDDLSKVECIVMGNDNELNFKKLEDVCKLLFANPHIPYIATNPDYVCPTEFGSVPDCGSVCDMIYNCTKLRPVFIGKPSPLMPQLAMEKYGISGNQTAVIGDRIYTDVKSGINAGAVSVPVMSGETTYEILNESPDKPDFVLKDGRELMDIINE